MTKQAKKSHAQQANLDLQFDLQQRFSKFSPDQKQTIANYLTAYNLAAWIYNEHLDEDMRQYVDLSMKYVIETQRLNSAMEGISDNPAEVQNLVDNLNNGD